MIRRTQAEEVMAALVPVWTRFTCNKCEDHENLLRMEIGREIYQCQSCGFWLGRIEGKHFLTEGVGAIPDWDWAVAAASPEWSLHTQESLV